MCQRGGVHRNGDSDAPADAVIASAQPIRITVAPHSGGSAETEQLVQRSLHSIRPRPGPSPGRKVIRRRRRRGRKHPSSSNSGTCFRCWHFNCCFNGGFFDGFRRRHGQRLRQTTGSPRRAGHPHGGMRKRQSGIQQGRRIFDHVQ